MPACLPMSGAAPDDEALFQGYAAGDRAAHRALIERWSPILLRVMRRGLWDAQEAQDLVQQTFLHVHRARHDFERGRKVRPWLMTIAMNVKRKHLRTLKRRREVPTELEDWQMPSQAPHDALRQEQVRLLHRAMEVLTPKQREVIELHWLEDLPFAEVAEVVGAELSAVKVRAHRGYARLREAMEALQRNPEGGPG